ncbi:hypothetical protein ABPG75_010063 [Micractinium tetrahymenae]
MGSTSLALDFLKLSAQQRDERGPSLFSGAVLGGLEEASAETGRCRIVVRVGQELCHFGKSAHGGALASLIDIVTSAAVAKVGRSIVLVNAELKVEGSGALVAQGTHVMFLSDTAPPVEKFMAKFRRGAGDSRAAAGGGASSAVQASQGGTVRAKL